MMQAAERRRTPGGWAHGAAAAVPRRWLEAQLAAGAPAAVVLFVLSRLDLLNAAHGRDVGDAVVRSARERLEQVAARGGGVVTRLGGRRFALTVAADGATALALASEAAEALAQPYAGGVVLGSRTAVAVGEGDEDAGGVLGRAGEALAQAGAGEGGAPTFARPGRGASLDALAVDLHHAIARDEIDILFQPQVRIADGAIIGAEALARWRHPALGPLGADDLFAAAGRADLGLPLSEHIQGRALAAAAAWSPALARLRLSVNLTAGDLMRAGFADALLARVAASGFPPSRLTFELIEAGPVDDVPAAAAALSQLRTAGCRIAMDDFGAGYSSLTYVGALPLDSLKLDKGLIEGLCAGTREARLVEAAIAMGRALGLTIVAEGVEDEEQLAVLATAGCDQYQGFLCAPPTDAETLAALVAGA